ncbi:MAG: hypothetical protein SOX64_07630 [Treponema sp.]|nr:hypothetical protein [Treponema sp.]
MKKSLFVVLTALALSAGSLFAQEIPAFDKPDSVVLDVSALKRKFKDSVRLMNLTEEENISFSVYYYEQKGKKADWQLYGSAQLKGYSDTASVDSKQEGKIRNVKYFAVVSEKGIGFKCSVAARNHDLHISVSPVDGSADEARKAHAFIIDAKEVEGKFKDRIRFENLSDDSDITFWVYAFNEESEPWQKVGRAHLKEKSDTDLLDTPLDNVSGYRYFAVASENGKEYSFSVSKKHNDLYIQVK